MADNLTSEQRRRNMSLVKNKNTKPELIVRSLLHRLGYRFRLHRRNLPGSPDIVLPKHSKVIFVHGCFWHGHDCPRGKRPVTNQEFWDAKLDRNIARDRENQTRLRELGLQVLVIWACQVRDKRSLQERLRLFMEIGETTVNSGRTEA